MHTFEPIELKNGISLVDHIDLAPGIILFENIVSQEKINELINMIQDNFYEDMSPARVGHGETVTEIRNNKMLPLIIDYKNPKIWWEFSQILWTYGAIYASKYNIKMPNIMETAQVLMYENEKENFFRRHHDGGSRIFSSVLYLNDVEEGGETEFEMFNLKLKPISGNLIMFPSNFPYLHEAHPPISNNKWAIVTWFRDGLDTHHH